MAAGQQRLHVTLAFTSCFLASRCDRIQLAASVCWQCRQVARSYFTCTSCPWFSNQRHAAAMHTSLVHMICIQPKLHSFLCCLPDWCTMPSVVARGIQFVQNRLTCVHSARPFAQGVSAGMPIYLPRPDVVTVFTGAMKNVEGAGACCVAMHCSCPRLPAGTHYVFEWCRLADSGVSWPSSWLYFTLLL